MSPGRIGHPTSRTATPEHTGRDHLIRRLQAAADPLLFHYGLKD